VLGSSARRLSSIPESVCVRTRAIGERPSRAGEVHYVAMELIGGRTLRECFAAAPELRERIDDNILVSRNGYAKIVDFGLAKLIDTSWNPIGADSPTLRARLRLHPFTKRSAARARSRRSRSSTRCTKSSMKIRRPCRRHARRDRARGRFFGCGAAEVTSEHAASA